MDRYGRSPNVYSTLTASSKSAPLAGTLAPWILYNASVRYQVSSAFPVSLLVNNLFNTLPLVDHTYSGSSGTPYNVNNYNVSGRAIYLEANDKFGK